MSRDVLSPVAEGIPFDNSTNGFVSDNAQGAIEEGFGTAANASRGPTICGFDGTGTSGRWLEFYSNNPSDSNPFIIAEPSELIALSVCSSSSSTGTITVYQNGTPIQTISLSTSRKNRIKGLSIFFTDLDEISVKITAGNIARPTIFMFIRTLP